jgi:hypothetical protein
LTAISNRRFLPFALLSLLAWPPPRTCLAGESFLSRNAKVPEAVPYGRGSDETTSRTPAAEAGRREEDEPQGAAPPRGTPSRPDERGQDQTR